MGLWLEMNQTKQSISIPEANKKMKTDMMKWSFVHSRALLQHSASRRPEALEKSALLLPGNKPEPHCWHTLFLTECQHFFELTYALRDTSRDLSLSKDREVFLLLAHCLDG